ncbi:putative LPS assembly protein LptD [Aureivirga marina]|uniref:putative LPS assembly protein LptD n=1 Tax=Aureivirga marina TaxID=1182451 RepID=UPI0018CBA211|nr:putative LPS assembly protein LptD [Aureivirga marina]
MKSNANVIGPKNSSTYNTAFLKNKTFIPTTFQQEDDSLKENENVEILVDTLQPEKKEFLSDIVDRYAEEKIVSNRRTNKTLLYNKAKIQYQDMTIEAGQIIINNNTNEITAKGIYIDSLGYTQRPKFMQAGQESVQDSIIFNFDTRRALIWGMNSEQQGLLTYGTEAKRVNDSTYYARGLKVTTSKKKNPDYYIYINKAKVIPNKKIIAGTANLVIADVPTPLAIPFAYIPLTQDRSSGLIIPTWGDSNQQGYFFQNGGYYFAINDYFDLTLLGDIYTNGSWGFRAQSNYVVRYKFRGNFSFDYENLITSLRGLSDYAKATNYNIRWSHSQDQKASPNSRFSASVNLGSSQYYRQSLNELNNNNFLTNTLSSSISYYKNFVGTPFNMTVSLTQNQNTNTESISMTLPALQVNMDRIYPFEPKSGSKTNALHKLGLTYSFRGENRINTTDEFFFKKEMWDDARFGIQHDVSANTNMKVLNYFTLSPRASYKEVWYFDQIEKSYDPNLNEVQTDTINGFTSFREYSFGTSLSTKIYGTFNFKKGKLKAIRHTITPSISYNYRPDFSFYNETVQTNNNPFQEEEYSPFQNGIFGSPSSGLSSSIGISVNNNVEAKIASDDPEEEPKRITLINNLSFSTSYNIAADSLNWSPVSVNMGTNFFNNKVSLNMNASLDPYAINADGRRINTFNIDNGGSLFRLTNAGLNTSFSLSSEMFNPEQKSPKNSQENFDDPDGLYGGNLNTSNQIQDEEEEEDEEKKVDLYNAKIPWRLSVNYALTYSKPARESNLLSSLQFNGDIELTPKWGVGFSSGYDFEEQGFTYTQLRFSRDLDSWKFNFNWVPFGTRRTYYFFIGVKSSVLSDLKYDQNQPPERILF